MSLDESKLGATLRALQGQLTVSEASAIVDVARIAASADGRTDPDEVAAIGAIAKILYTLAGEATVPVPSPTIDVARLLDIGNQLEAVGKRELAYACAMAVMYADLELTADERGLGSRLAEALLLPDERAAAITANVRSVVGASLSA